MRSLLTLRLAAGGALIPAMLAACLAHAHDPSAYGGLFRSRDFGASWLNADVGLFLGGVVSIAIDPTDSTHLLMGTDSGLLRSRNGGRAWKPEQPDELFGAVFSVLFLPDGTGALCVTPGGVYRSEGGRWQQARAPSEAAPARAAAVGAAAGRLYLLGRREPYRSNDGGRSWSRIEHELPDQPEFTALAVAREPSEVLYAIVDDVVMASQDGGRSWQPRNHGLPHAKAEALTLDRAAASRLWAASANRIYVSDDGGARWRAIGQPLPEPDTEVHGIAANATGRILVITTHRGLYRSIDAGTTWSFLEGNLPVHLEAKPLVRDATYVDTLYAGYALMPYGEIWRRAVEGGNLLGRVHVVSLAGGLAFLLLLGIAGVLAARWLLRHNHHPAPVAGEESRAEG